MRSLLAFSGTRVLEKCDFEKLGQANTEQKTREFGVILHVGAKQTAGSRLGV